MAALSASDLQQQPRLVETEDQPMEEFHFSAGSRREPVVTLLSPVCGLMPLCWSEDHRLAVSTLASLSVLELLCDVNSNKQELIIHRTSIRVPENVQQLRVEPVKELSKAVQKFSCHADPTVRQVFLADTVLNPHVGIQKGIKYTSWSPFGCDANGRCLLACLTFDHRLTIHNSQKRHEWNLLINLTDKYSQRLEDQGYAKKDNTPPTVGLNDLDELRRRYAMQTPLKMEWSRVYTVKQFQPNNTCINVEMVLLAVLMENGNVVLWKFMLPFVNGDDVVFYDVVESGVSRPSDLAWWEYESPERRMSGLIIGSMAGPIKIEPVSLSGVKGYFTVKHPVVLWKESDELAVENIKCIPVVHPVHKTSCSLIVATRSCYVFWCLLVISPAGLNVLNSHVAGLHSLPILSLAVSMQDYTVYTCSMDGWIKKLTPTFTETTIQFDQEDFTQPESLADRRIHGIAVSHNGAYIAVISAQGMVNNIHPVIRTYQVDFITLRTPDMAVSAILNSPSQSLFKVADLLDLLRWKILKTKAIPASLHEELEKRIQDEDSLYLWRFKLFLQRTLHQSLQSPFIESTFAGKDCKMFAQDDEEEEGEGAAQEEVEPAGCDGKVDCISEEQGLVSEVESHLLRENMKKVLGMVYLNTSAPGNTSIPTCGLVDYLSRDASDKTAEVLIGHIKKKLNRQTFPERCCLCEEELPFTDHKQGICSNGHMWLRCVLSYQACQTLTFRRCLLQDSVARLPEPEGKRHSPSPSTTASQPPAAVSAVLLLLRHSALLSVKNTNN
ncbi:general transcription factor 3C polypeptide 4 [Synchiropus splendidus]|uniref:general transcription factor 3C polypeptide 4 n=1 Tax=Synchiropus splendidus TaxID=270530 RepID=UPI00237D5D7A|nr:general transcription factor 3C polypeptide 4 [Synchiropus splendidus]